MADTIVQTAENWIEKAVQLVETEAAALGTQAVVDGFAMEYVFHLANAGAVQWASSPLSRPLPTPSTVTLAIWKQVVLQTRCLKDSARPQTVVNGYAQSARRDRQRLRRVVRKDIQNLRTQKLRIALSLQRGDSVARTSVDTSPATDTDGSCAIPRSATPICPRGYRARTSSRRMRRPAQTRPLSGSLMGTYE